MSLSPAATWRIGSLYGFTAVAFGAFGSHGLQRRFPDLPPRSLKNWEIATSYLLVHSVVLLVLASTQRSLRYERYAAPLIAAGAALFSGSIYGLVLGGGRFKALLGPTTPIGGSLMLAGWASMLFVS